MTDDRQIWKQEENIKAKRKTENLEDDFKSQLSVHL